MLYCVDIWNRLESTNSCCGSCHSEFENGYHQELEFTVDGSPAMGCCGTWHAVVRLKRDGKRVKIIDLRTNRNIHKTDEPHKHEYCTLECGCFPECRMS